MRSNFTQISLLILLSFSTLTLADEPSITNNVTVLHNAKPSQCTSSWRGNTGMDIIDTTSGYGQSNADVGSTVMSCSGCAIDPSSKDCVCQTCYQDYN